MSSMSLPAKRPGELAEHWLEPLKKLDGLSLLDQLYNRLDGLFPTRFRAQFPDDNSVENWKYEWAQGFAAERLTLDEVTGGLEALRAGRDPMRRDKGWPPVFCEFLAACRPPVNHEAAYHEAVRQMRLRHSTAGGDTWSSAAVFWAAVAIGGDLLSSTWQGMRSRWTDVLDDCIAEVRAGRMADAVPERPAALLVAPVRVMTEAERQQRELVTAKAVAALRDRPRPNAEWAVRIVERAASDPKAVTPAVLRAAQQAIGVMQQTESTGSAS